MENPLNNDTPSIEQDDHAPVPNHVNEGRHCLNENTPAWFKQEAMKKLAELRAPKTALLTLQSNPAFIMQQYDFDKSYLDSLSEWYAETIKWYEKGALFLLITGSGALTGLIIGAAMAPIFTLLTICIYYVTTAILTNHYNTSSRRNKRLRAHVNRREDNVTQSIALLEQAEQSINTMVLALCELNINHAEKLVSFEAQIATLTAQTTHYLATIQPLEHATNDLVCDNVLMAAYSGRIDQ